MELSTEQELFLNSVGLGIQDTELFIGELTEYHGDAVSTEYILTVDIAKALLTHTFAEVRIEYLINSIQGHALIHNGITPFILGSQRFDIAVLGYSAPEFIVETKIGVHSLAAVVEDLKKIMHYLNYLSPVYARRALGVSVFQTDVRALKRDDVEQTTKRIQKREQNIKQGMEAFAKSNPEFEFDWWAFQGPLDRVYDDEVIQDVDGALMLDRFGYAARYHAILVRKRVQERSGVAEEFARRGLMPSEGVGE